MKFFLFLILFLLGLFLFGCANIYKEGYVNGYIDGAYGATQQEMRHKEKSYLLQRQEEQKNLEEHFNKIKQKEELENKELQNKIDTKQSELEGYINK